jgi:uncharacterized membrane protein YuzA (DUF378 family)
MRWLYASHLMVEVGALAVLVLVGFLLFLLVAQVSGAMDLRRIVMSVLRRA